MDFYGFHFINSFLWVCISFEMVKRREFVVRIYEMPWQMHVNVSQPTKIQIFYGIFRGVLKRCNRFASFYLLHLHSIQTRTHRIFPLCFNWMSESEILLLISPQCIHTYTKYKYIQNTYYNCRFVQGTATSLTRICDWVVAFTSI